MCACVYIVCLGESPEDKHARVLVKQYFEINERKLISWRLNYFCFKLLLLQRRCSISNTNL